ncbi:MAG: hypothetical protein OXF93_24515 [Acidobacteria bacterium]|nr:hypothetical protein [Acidobacteriota bacterium]
MPDRVGACEEDVIEVCVAEDLRPVPPHRLARVFSNRARGRVGLEMTNGRESIRVAPTRMIATNLTFARAFERFLPQTAGSVKDLAADGRVRTFAARQFLVAGRGAVRETELFRGSTLVPPTPAGEENRADDLATGIGRWMLRNMRPDGGLPYKYWPSRGAESPADNAIRRFLASLSLARLGEYRGDAGIREAARRNLRFNLARYFRPLGGGRGAIVERTGAKLGAAALAALCILESPASSEFSTELGMLAAGVASLADDELGFRTFFFPPERDGENWNFYSGEALLFWAEALRRKSPGAPSIERCVAAFARCRARHRRARNPAFVPWHTQACASLFAQTGRREFADFVFETNDWLLPMQQWDRLPADLRGRFYDPARPEFGPPHAASTGAYLEGLADAWALARSQGDGTRAAAYRRVIDRGLRSLRQLQFRGPHDMFYIAKRERVRGALRTEAYDNAVRVDSAAHALAAALKLLRSTFLHD